MKIYLWSNTAIATTVRINWIALYYIACCCLIYICACVLMPSLPALCCSACLPFIYISPVFLLHQCLPLRLMDVSSNSKRHMINILVPGRSQPSSMAQTSAVNIPVHGKMPGEAWLGYCPKIDYFTLKSICFVKISCLKVSVHPFVHSSALKKCGDRRPSTQLGINQ